VVVEEMLLVGIKGPHVDHLICIDAHAFEGSCVSYRGVDKFSAIIE